jgi:hypothetical protein
VWLLDAWLDSFEDVSFGSSSSSSGDGSSGGTASSSFHTTPHAVAMLWRNKLLTLAGLSALHTVIRLYIDLSASTSSLGPSAARFLEEVNVLKPESGVIDAISTLAADAATAAESLQNAAAAASSGGVNAGGGGAVGSVGSSLAASSAGHTARPGLSIGGFGSDDSSFSSSKGVGNNNNANRALAAAAMHIPGLHDTPSRRRARAKARKHLQATILGTAGPGGDTLIDAEAVAAGIEVSAGEDGVRLVPPGVGLAKALLSLTHARSMSDGSGFRVRTSGYGGRAYSGDEDEMDAPDVEDDDGGDYDLGGGGEDYYGFRTGGPADEAGDELDSLLSGVLQSSAGQAGSGQRTLNDSAAARYRLLSGKAEIGTDIRGVIASSFGSLQAILPPQVWQTSILARVTPVLLTASGGPR